jgi:hypothetical protein
MADFRSPALFASSPPTSPSKQALIASGAGAVAGNGSRLVSAGAVSAPLFLVPVAPRLNCVIESIIAIARRHGTHDERPAEGGSIAPASKDSRARPSARLMPAERKVLQWSAHSAGQIPSSREGFRQTAGRMFWFIRNMFTGSCAALIFASRS